MNSRKEAHYMDLEERTLTAVIFNEVENYDDEGNATKWKIDHDKLLKFTKERCDSVYNMVKMLIVDEINIAHMEGTPTSRLTSLYNKLFYDLPGIESLKKEQT